MIANPLYRYPVFTDPFSSPVQYNMNNLTHRLESQTAAQLWFDTVVTLGYAGSRGVHLLRSNDVNIPTPIFRPDGTPFFPPLQARPNTAFTTIELKSSDGNSWYNAMVFEVRKRFSKGLSAQSSITIFTKHRYAQD